MAGNQNRASCKRYYAKNKEAIKKRRMEKKMSTNAYHREYYQAHKHEVCQKHKEKRAHTNFHNATVVVLDDPDKSCGFPKNAELNCLGEMLKMCSFTKGTLLKVEGKKAKVVESLGRQSLVWLE